MMIKPSQAPVIIEGRLSYLESLRAFGTIRLKRKIIDLFPQLMQDENWYFRLEYPHTKIMALQRIQEAEDVPLILYIYKGGDNGR